MTDELVKLLPREGFVPDQSSVVYPGNDAWLQFDQGGAVAPSGDPAWASLEHYLVSGGGTPKVLSANGNAKISTAQAKFGVSSALFDGTGDFISTPDHPDFALGAGDFTAEGWVRFADLTFDGPLMGQWDAAASQMSWIVLWNGVSQWSLASSVNGTTNVSFNWNHTPSNNAWMHLAFVRSGSAIRLFIEGTELAPTGQTLATALFNSTAPFVIGGRSDSSGSCLGAYLDELRLSKVARYTGNFTPPSAPFVTDANTLLLVHCDGADASTTFTDDSPLPPTGVDPGADPAWCQLEH